MNNNNRITLIQLAQLREESVRANKAYDAARKQWKAQQKAQARAARPEAGNHPLHDLCKGSASSRVYEVPCVPCVPAVFTTAEVATGEVE